MVEDALIRLANAVEQLAAQIKAISASSPAAPAAVTPAAPAPAAAAAAPTPAAAPAAAAAPTPAAAPAAAAPAAAAPAAAAPAVTYGDVKVATTELARAKGRDAVLEVLSKFGVSNAMHLPENAWGSYVEACRRAAV